MNQISIILDQMKKEVALGKDLQPTDVRQLKTLLTSVTRPRTASTILEAATLDDLRSPGRAFPAD